MFNDRIRVQTSFGQSQVKDLSQLKRMVEENAVYATKELVFKLHHVSHDSITISDIKITTQGDPADTPSMEIADCLMIQGEPFYYFECICSATWELEPV